MVSRINILGTYYKVKKKAYEDVPVFKERGIDGYCDDVDKVICVCALKTHPLFKGEAEDYCEKIERCTLRHEIIHAFLSESGLQESSAVLDVGWAKNEEMIDFFALQFPKIAQAFKMLGCE